MVVRITRHLYDSPCACAIYTVFQKVVHQAHIDNLVNSAVKSLMIVLSKILQRVCQ